jgi:hypothetical protein
MNLKKRTANLTRTKNRLFFSHYYLLSYLHLFETSTGLLSDFESYLKVAASIGVGGGLRVIASLPDNADDGILVASSRDISLDNHVLALCVGDLETIVGGFFEKVKAL